MNDEFSGPDGDIILRAHGPPSRDFRVHKLVLSLASPVFRDKFSVPQPKSRGEADITVVDVTDPPRALELILRLIYPSPPPDIESLDLLVEALVIADKYLIEGARAGLRVRLTNFTNEAPLRVYAIASRFGFDKEAEAASSLTTTIHLPALAELPDDLKHIPTPVYHKLIVLHAKHREYIEGVIDDVLFEPACVECKAVKGLAESRMRMKLVRIICESGKPITADPQCVGGLGIACKGTCTVKFVENVAAKLGGKNTITRPPPGPVTNESPGRFPSSLYLLAYIVFVFVLGALFNRS